MTGNRCVPDEQTLLKILLPQTKTRTSNRRLRELHGTFKTRTK